MYRDISRKWELLGALYEHGASEKKLQNELQDWDEKEILKAFKSYRERVKRKHRIIKKEGKEESIDLWHELVTSCSQIEKAGGEGSSENKLDYSYLLQKAFLYAACFEEHYQSSNPDEPNYNEIYRYLAQLLAGQEPTQLRPGNANKILEMLSKLKLLLENKDSVQRYLNYINTQHSISYLKPDVDVWAIVEEKQNRKEEDETEKDYAKLFSESDEDLKLVDLDKNDCQYAVRKEKIILKLSMKQRVLASTIASIPGMNPLEMVLPSLVKPPSSLLLPSTTPRKRKAKSENDNEEPPMKK